MHFVYTNGSITGDTHVILYISALLAVFTVQATINVVSNSDVIPNINILHVGADPGHDARYLVADDGAQPWGPIQLAKL